MAEIEQKLHQMGFPLPDPPRPVAAYLPAVQAGLLVLSSGQLPTLKGELQMKGIVGADVTLEKASQGARLAVLNALAAVKAVIHDLDRIERVVKMTVFVASTPEFTDQPLVANGASDFLQEVFGEAGRHARAAVSSPSLPLNSPVEVEITVLLKE